MRICRKLGKQSLCVVFQILSKICIDLFAKILLYFELYLGLLENIFLTVSLHPPDPHIGCGGSSVSFVFCCSLCSVLSMFSAHALCRPLCVFPNQLIAVIPVP